MNSIVRSSARQRFDARLLKQLVLVNGAVPLALLAWDAAHGHLGVNSTNFAIHTTGILGLIFLVLSLLVTPINRLTGWSTLVAARRRIGVTAFVYLALHFTIFFALDRGGSVRSTVHEILTRRYLQIGTAGLLILLLLALTSTDRMVSWLGARRWKRLHRLTYVACSAGALHYILLVKSDLRQPLAFAAVISALLGYRLVRHYRDLRAAAHRSVSVQYPPSPTRGFWSGELLVSRIFDETPDVRTFRLTAVDGGRLPFDSQPGQYLNLALSIDGKSLHRSYTIASSPTRTCACEITVKRTPGGYASNCLHDFVREGSRLRISAPAGRFVFTGAEAKQVILIGGGVGITPLMSMVRHLTDRCWRGEIYLVFSAKRKSDVIFQEELDYLRRRFPNLHVVVALSQEPEASAWAGARGHLTAQLLTREIPCLAEGPVYLCGPSSMMAALRKLLVDLGVAESRVHTEAFVSPPTPATAEVTPVSALDLEPGVSPPTGRGLVTIQFAASQKIVDVPAQATVLEAAEGAGVSVPFECRSGICGHCKTKLLGGQVAMEIQDALTATDRANALILACQARPVGDVTVDA